MRSITRITASAALGGLVLLCTSAGARAQVAPARSPSIGHVASIAPGSISGTVQRRKGRAARRRHGLGARRHHGVRRHRQERALRIADAVARPVSAARAPQRIRRLARRDRGSASERARVLRRLRFAACAVARPIPMLAAGIGGARPSADTAVAQPVRRRPCRPGTDDHSETAWRLRHARRSHPQGRDGARSGRGRRWRRRAGDRRLRARRVPRAHHRVARAPGGQFLRRHAVLGPGQPADDRIVRQPAAALHDRQLLAQRRLRVGWARRSGDTPTGRCAAR